MNNELQTQEHMNPRLAALFDTTGKRIRMLRVGRALTQLELSDALKDYGVQVNNTFISQIENGGDGKSKQPPMDMLVAVAKVLGTSTDFLLMLTDDPSPRGAQPEVNRAA